ncbi:MAG: hypothetical protein WC527_05430 [Candidatus Margulisiibacteriota bacterium]
MARTSEIGFGRYARMYNVRPVIQAEKLSYQSLESAERSGRLTPAIQRSSLYGVLEMQGIVEKTSAGIDHLHLGPLQKFIGTTSPSWRKQMGLKTRTRDASDAYDAIVGRLDRHTLRMILESKYGAHHDLADRALQCLAHHLLNPYKDYKTQLDEAGVALDLSGMMFSPSAWKVPVRLRSLSIPLALELVMGASYYLHDFHDYQTAFFMFGIGGLAGAVASLVVSMPKRPSFAFVNLKNTDLTNACFGYADFTGVGLKGAITKELNTSGTIGLEKNLASWTDAEFKQHFDNDDPM